MTVSYVVATYNEDLVQPDCGGELLGPWQQAFWVGIRGPWRSKSNFRRYRSRSAAGRWTDQVSFEQQVAVLALSHLPSNWDLGDPKARVSERPQIVAFIYAESLLDVPNLAKSTMDALEHICFHTDASVRHCACMGERRRSGNGLLAIARLAPAASDTELFTAADQLSRTTLSAWHSATTS